jgi:ABC-type branched-subunit amino acid transport system ATPase component
MTTGSGADVSAGPDVVLRVEGLSKSFGGLRAVSDLSFTIRRGLVTSLVGPNGAGKTTVFNLITGALRPDAGRVYLGDREITGLPPHQAAGLGIARTFQDLRLFLGMTVLDNVLVSVQGQPGERPLAVFGAPWRVRAAERRHREEVREILQAVSLLERQHELVTNLSFAEQKLLVIARALATKSELWLLDEPAAGLDAAAVQEIMDLVRRLAGRGQTVCIVEHNLRVVRHVSDRVLFLNEGMLLTEGTPEEIFSNQELRAIYLGNV